MRRDASEAAIADQALRAFVDAIVANHHAALAARLRESPGLAQAAFRRGASRAEPGPYFLPDPALYLNSGDTALHVAAACHRPQMVIELVCAEANVRAKNRRGSEPLHVAASGNPDSPRWDPAAQRATVVALLQAGADANAKNLDGTTPLHRAVRTRCAAAVRALLDHGANPAVRTRNGSTAKTLASITTGRGGSGSPAAQAQQQEILSLLADR